MTGFTETQLTVRGAIGQLCARFPDTYWQQHDQTETDPKEFRMFPTLYLTWYGCLIHTKRCRCG